MERDIRQRQRAACAVDAEHVWIILFVGRVDEGDNLGLIAECLGKERADGAVDLTAGEDFLFGWPAFALYKSAWDASACVGELAILNREGEEIDALLGVRGRGCG